MLRTLSKGILFGARVRQLAMEKYTLQQRLDVLRHYYADGICSASNTCRALRENHNWESYPSEQDIRRLIDKFQTTGSIRDDTVQVNVKAAVVLAEAQTNGTKKAGSRRRAASKADETAEVSKADETAEVESISTTVKKGSKAVKKETKKAETKAKGSRKRAAVEEEDHTEDDVLPEEEFIPEEVKVPKAGKLIKTKGSQKQMEEVPIQEEKAPVAEKGKSKGKKGAAKKVAEKKTAPKKAAKGKKEPETEPETELEAQTPKESDAEKDTEVTPDSKVNGDTTVKADSEKKGGRGRKRPATTPLDEADGTKVAKVDGFLNPTITDYKNGDFNIDKEFKLKISSWNIAGLRSWLKKDGLQYIEHEQPDILCLQETKCTPDQVPEEARIPGYHPYWLCMPGGHAGVAVYSKIMPIHVEYGIGDPEQDEAGRLITAEYEKFYLICVYVPNSGRKLVNLEKRMQWEALFRDYVQRLDKIKPVVIAGDMNVSHREIDLANPKANTKNAGFTPEERDAMTKLLELGYVDTFRHLYPNEKGAYTFWSYMGKARSKNVGWRLDYFIISQRAVSKVVENTIRSQILGSDHCPITLFLNI